MPTLTAAYLEDLARVRLEAGDLDPGVIYTIERSIDAGVTWETVRGATNITDGGVTVVYDYEYAPNVENRYRLTGPVVSDSFERTAGPGGLLVDGAPGSYASTPDDPALDITGDIDVRVGVWREDWSAPAADEVMAADYNDATDDRSWLLSYNAAGFLEFRWTTDGTEATLETVQSTASPADLFTGPGFATFRVTRDAATGIVTFYQGAPLLGAGTQFGDIQAGPTGPMYAGAADLEVGARDSGTQTVWNGMILALQVSDTIGSGFGDLRVVFSDQASGTTAFVDETGFPWTVHGTAVIVGNDQAWGQTDTGQTWHPFGTRAVYTVDMGAGRILTPSGTLASWGASVDGTDGLTDTDASLDVITPSGIITGLNDVHYSLYSRAPAEPSFFNAYETELELIASTGRATLTIGNAGTVPVVDVGAWQPGQSWRIRMRTVGTVIEARAWNLANPEPQTWHVTASSMNESVGRVAIEAGKNVTESIEFLFTRLVVQSVPPANAATATVTPMQDDVWLKSLAFPSLNQNLGCIQTTARTRRSRVGLFDVKGRHPVLGIADVGSTEAFTILFDTHSVAENTAITGLLTFGSPLLLQSPPDADPTGCGNIAAYPSGWFMPGDSTQVRPLLGRRVWEWQVPLTRVAAPAAQAFLPAHMTWSVLWQMVNTWSEVWDEWATWAELWNASVAPGVMFRALSGGESM